MCLEINPNVFKMETAVYTKPHVRLHSWWQNRKGTRFFVCIGKGFSVEDPHFVAATFLELGKTDPVDFAGEDLARFIQDGNLMPYEPPEGRRA